MTGKRAPGRPAGPNLRRGLRGSLDVPLTTIERPESAEMGGWVFHQRTEVALVVLMAGDRVVGTATCDIERPDVAASHEGAPVRSGWATHVDLGWLGDEVTISAHALVRRQGGPDGEDPGSVLLPFDARTVAVGPGRLSRGEVTLPEEVQPGALRVSGTADVRPALARVEVQLDDGPVVRARHSLPSTRPGETAEERVQGFAATLEVPDGARDVDIRVSAISTDGTRVELAGARAEVRADTPPPRSEELHEVRATRLARHLDALRRTFPPGSRILVAAHDLGVGGAQNYLDDLMRGLHARGLEMCVVAGSGGPLLDHIETAYDAPVLVVGPPPETPELLATRLRLIASFALEHGAAACLANTIVNFPAVLAAAQLGIPSMWALHESFRPAVFWHEYLGRSAQPAILAATQQALAEADEVLFVAEATRQLYADLVPVSSSSVVPYGIDLPAADALLATHPRDRVRAELDIPLDRRVLLCVGSVEPRKGQLALARAFHRLGDAADHASLYFVGASDSAYVDALRDYVRDAGLEHVHVVESDPDVMRWYAAADVLVSAADVESMPRTMLEAMVAGVPVAAVSVFGVPELVEDGVSGWLCEPNDLLALTELLRQAVGTGSTRLASMGAAARERAETHHASAAFTSHVTDRLSDWIEEPAT